MVYEGMVYRPPSEAYSLIIQVTIGCSQNSCTFCSMYKEKSFCIRDLADVLTDFAEARKRYCHVEKIFLADGDAFICKTSYLLEILNYIKINFPECKQVTSYASPKSVLLKHPKDLSLLQKSGLSMVYLGLESGNKEVLKDIKKGVTPETMIAAANLLHTAGIRLSVTAISGLGGSRHWKEHAIDTGTVLSAMRPNYIGLLTLMVEPGTPLQSEVARGAFKLLTPYDILHETKELLMHLDCPGCIFRANHASNYVNLRGTLNTDKEKMLALLEEAIEGNIHLKSEWMRVL